MPLSQEQIAALMGPTKRTPTSTPVIEPPHRTYKNKRNTKHVKWCDTEMSCLSRRCGSPTWIKINGVPKCNTHAIIELSKLLDPEEIIGEL
jgi:hypothetical protein